MMKEKNYVKPKAEHIAFYSKEEIAAVMPLDQYANADMDGNPGVGGSQIGTGPVDPGMGEN